MRQKMVRILCKIVFISTLCLASFVDISDDLATKNQDKCMSGLKGRLGLLLWISNRRAYLDQIYICSRAAQKFREKYVICPYLFYEHLIITNSLFTGKLQKSSKKQVLSTQ